ncbi:MAG: type II secretion system F family protein [Thermomicrobiales bacterium]|nr:type II secretion system F family protein [Thermomicrobiales bacterium]
MDTSLVMVGLVAIMALALVGLGLSRRNRQVSADEVMERMGRFATREEMLTVSEGGGRNSPNKMAQGIEDIVKGRAVADTSAALISRADVKITIGEYLMMRIGSAIGGFVLGFFFAARIAPAFGLLLGMVTALIGYFIPSIYLKIKARQRQKKFVNQLGDTITLMANSLRAGYSLLQTMEMVSRESKDPMATEFRRVVREVGLGISHQEAMANMLRRVPSEDLDLLVTAINIQHEVGGNLAQILTTLGHTIRERVRIKGEIGVLTAQVQLSGYIITALPVGLAALVFMLNPDYIMEMMVWPWICMPIASSIMVILGFFAMRKISSIEV